MTPLQSTGVVFLVSAAAGFILAAAVLPDTAPTRFGALCFWLARIFLAASVAAAALGILEIVSTDPGDVADDESAGWRAVMARSFGDMLYAGMLAGWSVLVQAVGMLPLGARRDAEDEVETD